MNRTVRTDTTSVRYGFRSDPEPLPESWADFGGRAPCGTEPAYEDSEAQLYYAVEVAVQDRQIIDYSEGIGENANVREEMAVIVRYTRGDGEDAIFREFAGVERDGAVVPRIVAESGPGSWPAVLSLTSAAADRFTDAPALGERDTAAITRLYGDSL
ncbi:hypothetical protein C497_03640 [Halalkalicoccus jeotgali B3]|uniref:Uncharacterized protein n=2 Tax=Halalkalicoccus jeotgali TaxID=413810 RepID=D8J9N0_HALJB|nr:hypothetical protein [Halalkalicoccus jeotgali]ADJ14442.1 hypothetical protein HacjB3_05255 [Halalkalicoccus jeotgali B3]ELY40158.1 hypothetical protein C497_03640 [Halalkalicoccus jeotgali B3]